MCYTRRNYIGGLGEAERDGCLLDRFRIPSYSLYLQ